MPIRRVIFLLCLATLGALIVCPPSRAEVPPNNSSVEPVMIGTPSGTQTNEFITRILDVNSVPQPNRLVSLDFSQTSIRLYTVQNSGTTLNCAARILWKLTDAGGFAKFAPRFGGYENGQVIEVSVDGVVLSRVLGRSPDLDAQGGTVGLTDFAIFAAGFGAVQPHPETNFNESVSNVPDLGDLAVLSEQFARAYVGSYCP